jgi:hypothetical protein
MPLWRGLRAVGDIRRPSDPLCPGSQPTTSRGVGETRAEHNEVEAQMLYRSWQKDHAYRGFMLVKNYSCFAYEIAQNSSQHARALFFDREIKRVTEIAGTTP